MAPERSLPKAFNPLLSSDSVPSYEELVDRRRLGQTILAVKPGQIGTSNATRPQNLGVFDYAHLRAPLPKDLKDSGIFVGPTVPESYFLMRRSSDGYISATGMFKASFPWAAAPEEEAERKYMKSLPTTSTDETAGNIWISPTHALELAKEYKMSAWIKALLDASPIEKGQTDPKKSISPPPKFVMPDVAHHLAPPMSSATPGRGRGRPRSTSPAKSASPAKNASPNKKTASPRKRATKAASAAHTNAASATLQAALNNAASAVDPTAPEAKEPKEPKQVKEVKEHGKVEVQSAVDTNGDTETTHTKVKVEMPAAAPNAPLPENPQAMIAEAKKMVEEAQKSEGRGKASKATKRKADELAVDEAEEGEDVQPPKKAKRAEDQLKKERVKTRALIGLSATLALGALIPYVL
ncbi:MAG: hypothetical protein M1817_005358 [Caeruleum heppii]|nr:MAG: hypothetical protein M1817_005358 [Caeruleum heppii]